MRKILGLLFIALSFNGLSAQRFVYVDMEYMFSQIQVPARPRRIRREGNGMAYNDTEYDVLSRFGVQSFSSRTSAYDRANEGR